MRRLLKEVCSPACTGKGHFQGGALCLCSVNKGWAGFGSSMYSSVMSSLVLIFSNWLVDYSRKHLTSSINNCSNFCGFLGVCLFLFCFGSLWYTV